jgi:hypothetical protein
MTINQDRQRLDSCNTGLSLRVVKEAILSAGSRGRHISLRGGPDPRTLEQSGRHAITWHKRACKSPFVDLAHSTGGAVALEDRLSDAQMSSQSQRSCGPGDELGRHITSIASHYACLPLQHGAAVEASIGSLDLCWPARRRQAAEHFRAERNHAPLHCQLAQSHLWATLTIKAAIQPEQTGAHQDQSHFLILFSFLTLLLLEPMRALGSWPWSLGVE